MSARRQAFDYFVAAGWTPPQAAGIVANLEAESGLRPDAVGDGGRAYGIAQWHPPRQAGFAAAFDKDIRGSSFEDQLAFVQLELNGSEYVAGAALRMCTTPEDAARVVSTAYERPADRDGEARRRAERATAIFVECSPAAAEEVELQAPAPIEERGTPYQPPESPMGALLAALLPSVLALFAPRAQVQIAKVTGADPATAEAFTKDLFSKIGQVTQVGEVKTEAQAIQAVAAIQNASKTAPDLVQAVEAHALDYLDKLAPLFDRLAEADQAQWQAEREGRDAASARAARDRWDMTPWLVWIAGGTSTVLVLALLGAIIWQATTGDNGIDTALIGLAGPLLAIAMGVWREIFAYRFDGTPQGNATNAINAELARIRKGE